MHLDGVGGAHHSLEGAGQGVEGELGFVQVRVIVLGATERPLCDVRIDGLPQGAVGHQELDVVNKAIDGNLRDGQRLLVAPEVNEAQGQLAGNLGRLGMEAHASRGHRRGVRGQPLSALGPGHEGEGLSHVVPVGAGARRVFLTQGIAAEAVGAGGGLNVAPVAGVLADHVEGFEDAQGRPVVAGRNRGLSVGEGGHRHADRIPTPCCCAGPRPHNPRILRSCAARRHDAH